jgi:isoleucyl-tRNA synthetase
MSQEQRQALTPIKLRKKAAAYAQKQVAGQMAGFKRWGIWADWEHPLSHAAKGLRSRSDRRLWDDGAEGPHLPRA